MGAFTSVTVLNTLAGLGGKCVMLTAVGPASYDAGGSVLDLSVTALGAEAGLTNVRGVAVVAIDASAGAKYWGAYIAGASAALGKLFLRDLTASSDAEATGDLSARTFTLIAFGS